MIWRFGIFALLVACGATTDEQCSNGLDDDGDGLADCADDECFSPSCLEICDDGVDNNENGLADCTDPQCDGKGCGELCDDGRDNDRNGDIDCADEGCLDQCDEDGDGFLDGTRGGEDCNDLDEAVNPDAPELCNGLDDNCNGLIDRDDPDIDRDEVTLWHLDEDGDGYGSMIDGIYECDQPPGRVDNGEDCDDSDETVNPLTPEVCNGVDDNCDGLIDDEDPLVDVTGAATWYPDNDNDGYGSGASSVVACAAPIGYVDNADDCDDNNAAVSPGLVEICDGFDNDCANGIDDGLVFSDYWPDNDNDGFGAAGYSVNDCAAPAGYVDNDTDCDDTDAGVLDPSTWLLDGDADGYGAGPEVGPASCVAPGPDYVPSWIDPDCDDVDPTINPAALEICGDGIDSDCDGNDCSDWTDDFEAGAPLLPEWTTGGNAVWFVQGTTVHAGAFAAESGNITDNQASWMRVTLTFNQAGSVSFWHTGSTENGWDFLEFYIDGVQQQTWSGTWPWTQTTFPVGVGQHDLEWRYAKDGSVSAGADTVWLDDITVTNGSP